MKWQPRSLRCHEYIREIIALQRELRSKLGHPPYRHSGHRRLTVHQGESDYYADIMAAKKTEGKHARKAAFEAVMAKAVEALVPKEATPPAAGEKPVNRRPHQDHLPQAGRTCGTRDDPRRQPDLEVADMATSELCTAKSVPCPACMVRRSSNVVKRRHWSSRRW